MPRLEFEVGLNIEVKGVKVGHVQTSVRGKSEH